MQLVFSFKNVFYLSLNKPSMSLVVSLVVVHQNGISFMQHDSMKDAPPSSLSGVPPAPSLSVTAAKLS